MIILSNNNQIEFTIKTCVCIRIQAPQTGCSDDVTACIRIQSPQTGCSDEVTSCVRIQATRTGCSYGVTYFLCKDTSNSNRM